MTLSAAGESFLGDARRILEEATAASETARRVSRGEAGRLIVGFACLATSTILTKTVRDYRKMHPHVDLSLHEMPPATQAKALATGRIHVGYTRRFADPVDSFEVLEILRDRYLVAAPEEHPIAGRKKISLAALSRENIVMFKRSDTHSFFNQIYADCVKAGFSPNVVGELDVLQTIFVMVDAGAGISVVPSCVSDLKHDGVVLLPLVQRIEPNPVVLERSKNQDNPTLLAFVDLARGHRKLLENKILPPKWSRYNET